MNGRYTLAETSADRIAIAVMAGTNEYFRQHPHGVTPGMTFMAEWLSPFIELELMDARMEELHRIQVLKLKEREKELSERRAELVQKCQKKVSQIKPESLEL